jgi:hypothetical protein
MIINALKFCHEEIRTKSVKSAESAVSIPEFNLGLSAQGAPE